MFGIGSTELVITLLILLVLFGGTRLPKLARSIGRARTEFDAGRGDADTTGTNSRSDRRRPTKEDQLRAPNSIEHDMAGPPEARTR